jgi:hypothetical protein
MFLCVARDTGKIGGRLVLLGESYKLRWLDEWMLR